ncbi:MAG: DUF350 domain-containing protein [Gemmatimonadaceae bacterium]
MNVLLTNVGSAAVFAGLGFVLLMFGFVLIDLLTPGKLWDEVVNKHNNAGAILIGSVAIAMGIIIAAAIH